MAKKAAPNATTLRCPECDGSIADTDATGKPFVVCPHCAAFSKMDRGMLRLLHTDEWWALMTKPEWNDLMDYRLGMLERLTGPCRPS